LGNHRQLVIFLVRLTLCSFVEFSAN